MTPQRILCPVDFSECSQKALEHACGVAARTGAKLFIVHVQDVGHTCPPGNPGYVEELDQHKRLLEEAKPCAEGIDFEQHYMRGHVIDEIRRFAVLRHVDLIVLGTHGRTGLARVLMGSVAESLSKDSPCEVITVPSTQNAIT
jgi:nucleotide-binding universal stress UspA family protein